MTMPIFAPGLEAATAFLGGLAFGCAYFAVLRRTVDFYTAGRGLLVPRFSLSAASLQRSCSSPLRRGLGHCRCYWRFWAFWWRAC